MSLEPRRPNQQSLITTSFLDFPNPLPGIEPGPYLSAAPADLLLPWLAQQEPIDGYGAIQTKVATDAFTPSPSEEGYASWHALVVGFVGLAPTLLGDLPSVHSAHYTISPYRESTRRESNSPTAHRRS